MKAKASSIALSPDGSLIAIGDQYGKIFVVRKAKREAYGGEEMEDDESGQTYFYMQSLSHWHSNAVSCLQFVPHGATYSLISAGRESVLVQWNLSTNEK